MSKRSKMAAEESDALAGDQPTEPAAEAEPAADPTPAGVPVRRTGALRLEVFLRLTGKRADQLVPFARWAKKQGLRPRPLAEWRSLFDQFMNRPVTG